MNTYLIPVFDKTEEVNSITSIKANSFKEAFEKLSDKYDLEVLCETQIEFEEAMAENDYLVGNLNYIDNYE